jgi:hypothetical protein
VVEFNRLFAVTNQLTIRVAVQSACGEAGIRKAKLLVNPLAACLNKDPLRHKGISTKLSLA